MDEQLWKEIEKLNLLLEGKPLSVNSDYRKNEKFNWVKFSGHFNTNKFVSDFDNGGTS